MDYYLPKIIRYYRPFSMDFSLPFTSIISRQLYSNLSMKKLIQKQLKEKKIFKQYCILEIIRKKILESMEHFHSEDLLNRDHEDIYGLILLKCFSTEEFAYWPE